MSKEKIDNECKGCRPAAIDARDGKVLRDDSAIMKAINRVWDGSTDDERSRYHRFMHNTSPTTADTESISDIIGRMQAAIAEAMNEPDKALN